jgi:hypothetical protein
VWDDLWIHIPSTYQIQSLPISLPCEALVSSLLDPISGRWNEPLIKASFSSEEVEAICRMVPSPIGNADKIIWIASSTRVFIVRSAYYSKMSRRAQAMGESPDVKEEKEIWQAIWNLKASAAVQNFVWKMCSNILPTKVQLN